MNKKQEMMAIAAGLHVGAAAGAFIAIAIENGQSLQEARRAFADLADELFKDATAEFGHLMGEA